MRFFVAADPGMDIRTTIGSDRAGAQCGPAPVAAEVTAATGGVGSVSPSSVFSSPSPSSPSSLSGDGVSFGEPELPPVMPFPFADQLGVGRQHFTLTGGDRVDRRDACTALPNIHIASVAARGPNGRRVGHARAKLRYRTSETRRWVTQLASATGEAGGRDTCK